nr:EOG090X0A3R [Cyclestheria hislopi]
MASVRLYSFLTIARRFSCSSRAGSAAFQPNVDETNDKRITLFEQELKKQQSLITRIEKIEVKYQGLPEDATLIMNKGVSTPFNCAQHMSELLTTRSVVAEVNGELWDMHRPLESDCTLKLLHMKTDDVHHAALVNKTFWRSCSFLMGAVIERAFKDDIHVLLHSFPSANVRSGSFVYDVQLGLENWQPTLNELRQLSAAMVKFSQSAHTFQRLETDASVALKLFENNPFKIEQIPQIAAKSNSGNTVTIYRIGNHLDISRGPMIASTNQVGRCSIIAVHKLDGLYRFQGIALPSDIYLNQFAYGILEGRARKLNPARIPELHVKKDAV